MALRGQSLAFIGCFASNFDLPLCVGKRVSLEIGVFEGILLHDVFQVIEDLTLLVLGRTLLLPDPQFLGGAALESKCEFLLP